MQAHGWTLLFHECLIGQLEKFSAAAARAKTQDPRGFESNANVKLFNALGHAFRHWRRAKIGRRFRLFFRFDSQSKVIIYAWVNDENTLRSTGGKSDPYAVFQKMRKRGYPPDDWAGLLAVSKVHGDSGCAPTPGKPGWSPIVTTSRIPLATHSSFADAI